MKKIIYTIFVIYSFNAYASKPVEVFIGGQFNFSSALVEQEQPYTAKSLPHNAANKNSLDKDNYYDQDANIDILAVGKTDSTTLYGGRAVIQLDSQMPRAASYNANRELTYDDEKTIYIRKAFMFAEKKTIGRVEAGDVEGASKKMKFDASYRFGGTGGIAGSWWKYVNIPSFGLMYDSSINDGEDSCATAYAANDIRYCGSGGKGNMSFMIRPELPMSHGHSVDNGADKFDDTRTMNRISYFSPRIAGIQAGASYTPDSGDRGDSYYGDAGLSANISDDVRDILDWGINYVQQFNNFGLGISFTGERGFAENTDEINDDEFLQTDLQAYAAGLYIFMGNLSLSGSYGWWNDSLMMVRRSLNSSDNDHRDDDASYYTGGISYQFGPFKIGAAGMKSIYREQEFTLVSTAIDYHLSKNLTLYAEWNEYEFSADVRDTVTVSPIANAGQTLTNSGGVILLGAKLRFGEFDSVSQIVLDTSADTY